jgi:hypothetical protein
LQSFITCSHQSILLLQFSDHQVEVSFVFSHDTTPKVTLTLKPP